MILIWIILYSGQEYSRVPQAQNDVEKFILFDSDFSYTLVDVDAPLPDDDHNGRGAISYILSDVR